MGDYQNVLKRLAAYRKSIGMTQKQIGENLGMSQEQYSYLENGKTKITEDNLRDFLKNGWNIDYLITGMEYKNCRTKLDDVLAQFQDKEVRIFVMKLVAEMMLEKAKYKKGDAAYELLEAVIKAWDDFSMTFFIREHLQMSQTEMAEKIGIGIKKYRDIEKEKRFPDAEMLLTFYTMSGYQPLLFLDYEDRRMMSIKMVWNKLSAKEKSVMLQFIQMIKSVL